MLQGGLQAEVEPVAAAQVEQEVARAERRARVVHQLPGRRQAIGLDLKPLALERAPSRWVGYTHWCMLVCTSTVMAINRAWLYNKGPIIGH